MIRGVVNARLEAVLRLRILGPGGTESQVDAVLEPGFSGLLTVPASEIAFLNLAYDSSGTALLADGSTTPFDYYTAEVEWDGAWRTTLISAVGDDVLVGMKFLKNYELRMEVVPGGAVEIKPLP